MDAFKWEVSVCDDNSRDVIGDGNVVVPTNAPIELACAAACVQASFWPKDEPWTKSGENVMAVATHPRHVNGEKWLELEVWRN